MGIELLAANVFTCRFAIAYCTASQQPVVISKARSSVLCMQEAAAHTL